MIICPSGVLLSERDKDNLYTNKNIMSSIAIGNKHENFFLGIVGRGRFNENNPDGNYIFKDISGNTFPNNTTKNIDYSLFNIKFNSSNRKT